MSTPELKKSKSIVRPLPSIQVVSPSKCHHFQWKNGLGETTDLAIHPAHLSSDAQDFVWKFCLSSVIDSCSFNFAPGYDVGIVGLPSDEGEPFATLYHNDNETPVPLKLLIPYTFDGSWHTVCKLKAPLTYLTLTVNRKWANVSMNLEKVTAPTMGESVKNYADYSNNVLAEDSKDVNASKAKSTASSKILLGNYTIIYVISGSINVKMMHLTCSNIKLGKGEAIVCERLDSSSPADISMTPDTENDNDSEDALVLLVQINTVKSITGVELTTPELKPMSVTRPMRDRTSSIIIFDELTSTPPSISLTALDSQMSLMDLTSIGHSGAPPYLESAKKYIPPAFTERSLNESDVPPPIIKDSLVIEDFPTSQISTAWINMVKQGLSDWIRIPVIVARGKEPGPVVGITAVIHGNELNGVPTIHRVINELDVSQLSGTLVAVPCVNVPGYLRFTREFSDGKDLNRTFPGNKSGTASQVYAYEFMHKIIKCFDYLIDLHTASFGRLNSYYVRADMNDPVTSTLTKLQQPQIILHNSGNDGTLRSEAMSLGIKAITVEIGNPQLFQSRYVLWSYSGVMRILSYLSMFTPESDLSKPPNMITCSKGFWIYTTTGGVLEVYPNVNTFIRKGDLIARIKNIFGNIVDEVYAPASGITIGRSSNPVAQAGDRILHLGIIQKEGEILAKEAKENY